MPQKSIRFPSISWRFLGFLWIFKVVSAECPSGMTLVETENLCLFPQKSKTNFIGSERVCEIYGGDLVKIKDAFLNSMLIQFASDNLNNQQFYIGVRQSDGIWTYVDGTVLTFTKWDTDEPKPDNSCAFLNPLTGSWISNNCEEEMTSICALPLHDSSLPTQSPPKTTRPSGTTCDTGWSYAPVSGFCYYVQDFFKPRGDYWAVYNFTYAEQRCNQMNGHLVSIHNEEENAFVMSLFGLFIGSICLLIFTDLIFTEDLSWAINDTDLAAGPCTIAEAFIGLRIETEGTQHIMSWTDGSPVDYLPIQGFSDRQNVWFMLMNDPSCVIDEWLYWYHPPYIARFVCKKPPK